MMQEENYVYVNGKYVERTKASVSVFDHGLLYGDGIFEGMREYNGVVFQMKEHMKRLYNSAKYIRLSVPLGVKEMEDAIIQTLRRNNLKDAYIRVVVTRGTGDLGVDPKLCDEPNVFIITEKMESVLSSKEPKVIRAIVSSYRRDPTDATSHEVKSLNYLNSVLARIEANEMKADDAIMLDKRGFVSEATVSNVFLVRDGKVVTPSGSSGILRGITRARVIKLCTEIGIEVEERDVTPYELLTADEVFLTGTKSEIVAVASINSVRIGKETPGNVTNSIYKEFRKIVSKKEEGVSVFEEPITYREK
jgi:branched-chain amino acid aminotransferase